MMDPVTTLVAESEIRALLAAYAQRADDADESGYAALFTDNGVLTIEGARHEGRAAIGAWLMSTLSRPMRHVMANIIIDVTSADAASGTSDGMFFRKYDQAWRPYGTARYQDRYVRGDGGWLFAERHIRLH